MRQIWITKAGPPEVLEVREAPDPAPKAGEVRIRVEASGINFADILGRLGMYPDLPPMPVVPGYEVAGRVDAAGADVAGRWLGRDVFALTRFGGYADTICVPSEQVFERPAGMSALEAAAIPVNYFTAWQLLVVMGGFKPNETVLVHSVGGGVGIAATQLAKHLGGRVIGTASAAKHAEMRAIGVDHLIDYRTEDFEKRVREITGGRGVELILDAVGGESWKKGYRVLAPTGRLGVFGISAAASGKERSVLGMIGATRQYALVSVQSSFADECQQGRLRRQSGTHVGRGRAHARMGRSTAGVVAPGRRQAEDRAKLPVRRGGAGASLHSGSPQHRQGASGALIVTASARGRQKQKERG